MNFPTGVATGTVYTFEDRSWRWTGSSWVRVVNAGQQIAVFAEITTVYTLAALPSVVAGAFVQLTYV